MKELIFVLVDKNSINECGKFQTNFRNSNGKVRASKIMLNLKNPKMRIIRIPF